MTRLLCTLLLLIPLTAGAAGGMPGMGNIHAVTLKHLEWQGASTYDMEVEGWYGDGLRKLVYKIDAHKMGDEDTETAFDLGWQTAISPFWDAKALIRHADEHGTHRTWIGAGLSGTLPYFIHFDSHLMTGEGDALLDIELLHELPINRHWKIESTFELEAIAGDERGIDEVSIGFRIGHESVTRFTKYIGMEWQHSPIEDTRRTAFVAGISYWY